MIATLKGTVEEAYPDHLVLDVNGIGFMLWISGTTYDSLPAMGSEAKVYTRMTVREDSMDLYGFASVDERACFDMLVTVTGVGPKAALSILSTLTVADLRFAILGGDTKQIVKAPGVGKKIAERIVLELKDKINLIEAYSGAMELPTTAKAAGAASANTSVRIEVMEALKSLGYSASDAAKALDKMTITESTTTEQLLSDTLRQMSFL